MKTNLIAAIVAVTTLGTGTAFASERCSAPMSEWQPREALQRKLEAQGWKVRRIKTDDGCYEAYAIDAEGRRVEAYFDPKTFAMVKKDDED